MQAREMATSEAPAGPAVLPHSLLARNVRFWPTADPCLVALRSLRAGLRLGLSQKARRAERHQGSAFARYFDICQNIEMKAQRESLFRALADRQRREILRLLRHGELPAGQLADSLAIAPSTVSHHLARLRDAELVRVRREGQQRIYALNVSVVEDALLQLAELIGPREEA